MHSGDTDIFARLGHLKAEGRSAALVTVVRSQGSTPREAGAKMIVHEDRSIEGTIGGGAIEFRAIDEALVAIRTGRPIYIDVSLTQELGMCCGGSTALFIDPIVPRRLLIIFGAGHVGLALTRFAHLAGFSVAVVDERESFLRPELLPEADALFDDPSDPRIPFGPEVYVMVTTHDHAIDQAVVERVLKQPHAWVGLIGSRRKAELTRRRLAQKGFAEAQIQSLRCPVGVAIGAESPEEIAVSIIGELIARHRGAVEHALLERKA